MIARVSVRARVPFLVAALVLAGASPASARAAEGPDDVAEARADYDAAAAAYDRQDYATAAARFARADERAPNPRALQLAMARRCSRRTRRRDELVDRRRFAAATSSESIVERESSARGSRRAPRASACLRGGSSATLDGAVMPYASRWVPPGRHVVAFDAADGSHVEIALVLAEGQTIDVPVDAPDAARALDARRETPPRAARERRGTSPAFFWAAAGATAAAAGVATVFTVVLERRHDDFVARPSAETAAAGDRAQTNVRVAWAVTGAFAVTTGVLALLTDFGGARATGARGPRVALGWSGLSLAGRFE